MTKEELIVKWTEEKKKCDLVCNEHVIYYTSAERLKALCYSAVISLILKDIKEMT